jgi:putative oligomerization/nucleic acid binding protein
MPGLLRGMARTAVVAGTATAVSNRVSRRQSERWASQEPAPEPAPAAPASNGESRIEKLKELGALKEQGVLNDEEFEAEKARVLS